jgi:hypothetical protein
VRQAAITHEDSLGNKGRTEAGDVGAAIENERTLRHGDRRCRNQLVHVP